MTIIKAPATVVQCIWCDHTETGAGYAPHDAIIAHHAAALTVPHA